MAREGVLEKAYKQLETDIINNHGVVKLEYISDFIKYLQRNMFDAHILIGGPNGVGKSMLMLALMKLVDPSSIEKNQVLYAFNTTSDFINMLSKLKNTAVGIDEINRFLHYKQSMTTESIGLVNAIEISREHRVCVISCCRDGRKVNNNYRDGKVQLYIMLVDRYEKGRAVKTYGFVFANEVGSVLETQDKFMLRFFEGIHSFEQLRIVAEHLPTFYGYLFVDDIFKYVTPEQFQEYSRRKEEGIQATNKRWIEKILAKNPVVQENTQKKKIEVFVPL